MDPGDILMWSIIILADILLLGFGLYSAYKFVRAVMDKADLMRYKGYLINAFIMLFVLVPAFTYGGYIISRLDAGVPKIGIAIDASRGVNDRISLASESISLGDDRKAFELAVRNDAAERKELSVDISCVGRGVMCSEVEDLLTSDIEDIAVESMVIYKLPIKVNFDESTPEGEYNFKITVKEMNGTVYDEMELNVKAG